MAHTTTLFENNFLLTSQINQWGPDIVLQDEYGSSFDIYDGQVTPIPTDHTNNEHNEDDLNDSEDQEDREFQISEPKDVPINLDENQDSKPEILKDEILQCDTSTKPESDYISTGEITDIQEENAEQIPESPKPKKRYQPFTILRKPIRKLNKKKVIPFVRLQMLSGKALKNVAKNYGKFCTNWALKPLGLQLVLRKLKAELLEGYKEYINERKDIGSIKAFRDLLLVEKEDSVEVRQYKQAFQYISEILVREYSHNWIFSSSRIEDQWALVCAKEKILRRIREPEFFTYLT